MRNRLREEVEPLTRVYAGSPPIEVVLKRSARARRLSLRVSRLDGRVTLSLPEGFPEGEAVAFAEEKADWIRSHLSAALAAKSVHIGGSIPVEGRQRTITKSSDRQFAIGQDYIAVPGGETRVALRLRAYLKQIASQKLRFASDHYAKTVGQSYQQITLRDTKSRWGSCTAQGNLMYSWRLIMAPPEVLTYVAAHEVAHLVHMDHSPSFWSLVDQLYPGYKDPRKWLRDNGAELHRYKFD